MADVASQQERLIAVVDDDRPLLDAILSLLRSYGYRVAGFESGEELLASGAELVPCCVLADVQLDGMSGLELARRLRQGERTVPIVLLTGRDVAELDAAVAGLRAVTVVGKPFQSEDLIAAIERVVAAI